MSAATGGAAADETPTALVVVDLQRGLLEGADAVHGAGELTKAVRELLGRARGAGALVVHLQHDGPPGAVDEPGRPGWQLALTPAAGETVLRKCRDDGFDGTDLGPLLARHAVRAVVVVGLLSEMCVATTARTAMARGMGVVLPRGGHATCDVPAETADPLGAPAVPAAQVSRVAEWSLGDTLLTPPVGAVRFTAASLPSS